MERLFSIGKIVNTQGVKGEVRVLPSTDDVSRFGRLKGVILVNGEDKKTIGIERVRYHKNFAILKFDTVDDMTDAEKLKGYTVKIPESQALKLEADEYYIMDLIGLNVFTESGEPLGELTDVLRTGANDVYVINQIAEKAEKKEGTAKKVDKKKKEILIPAIKQCIINVDVAGGKMVVNLLEGLR
ncbi:MAG: ribosome maturation factor RimM [Clostridiales bacterium]|jgi:16S rRNA processing protein RimM|nr:ribosome maturation factor RimM [Clostridiales bacterium]